MISENYHYFSVLLLPKNSLPNIQDKIGYVLHFLQWIFLSQSSLNLTDEEKNVSMFHLICEASKCRHLCTSISLDSRGKKLQDQSSKSQNGSNSSYYFYIMVCYIMTRIIFITLFLIWHKMAFWTDQTPQASPQCLISFSSCSQLQILQSNRV